MAPEAAAPTNEGVEAASNAAVILPAQPDSVSPAAVPVPANASKDAMALSEIFTPASERKHVVSSLRVKPRARDVDDSDVALLTALIRHVEVGDPSSRKLLEHIRHAKKPSDTADTIEARMQACPAANTEAGLHCRQRLCAGHSGQSTACPAATGGS
jgi:hypothetical protein